MATETEIKAHEAHETYTDVAGALDVAIEVDENAGRVTMIRDAAGAWRALGDCPEMWVEDSLLRAIHARYRGEARRNVLDRIERAAAAACEEYRTE